MGKNVGEPDVGKVNENGKKGGRVATEEREKDHAEMIRVDGYM